MGSSQSSGFSNGPNSCAVGETDNISGCPVHNNKIDSKNLMPPPNQRPAPGQRFPLPTDRVRSSIPKAASEEKDEEQKWEYPSPQMFFNAMKRKGYRPYEEDMVTVVSIHNAVNEQCWRRILEWESLHTS